MTRGHAIIDKAGMVVATNKWGGDEPPKHCPIAPPAGGMAVELEGDDLELVIGLMKGGQRVFVVGADLMVDGVSVGTIESRQQLQ